MSLETLRKILNERILAAIAVFGRRTDQIRRGDARTLGTGGFAAG